MTSLSMGRETQPTNQPKYLARKKYYINLPSWYNNRNIFKYYDQRIKTCKKKLLSSLYTNNCRNNIDIGYGIGHDIG